MQSYIATAARIAATLLVAGGLVLPATIASAQDVPSYADQAYPQQSVPSYAHPNDEETLHGRIEAVPGTFDLVLRDDRGFIDNVELHQGTIINPTGLTLANGMSVTIIGRNAGPRFAANEIDAPYRYDGPAPVSVYYGPGWWYPGFAYGYGPSFSLSFVFGGGYSRAAFFPYFPYHGPYFHGGYAVVPRGFVGRSFAGAPAYRPTGATRELTGARSYATGRTYAAGTGSYTSRGSYTPHGTYGSAAGSSYRGTASASRSYSGGGSSRSFSGGAARGGGGGHHR